MYVFDGGVEAEYIAGASAEGRAGETATRPGSALLGDGDQQAVLGVVDITLGRSDNIKVE
jgi:hypothetical protein